MLFRLLCLLCFFASDLSATFSFRGPHTFYAGPEVYYVKRTKKGGTTLDGVLYGAYFSYDRVRRCSFYWALDYSVAYGQLSGKGNDDSRQKSWLLDQTVEGRIGYTYGTKKWKRPYITPFVGYGYFYETNRFVDPSPLEVKFRDTFAFGSVGFLSGLRLNSCWSLGVLCQAKWMLNGQSRITGDSSFENVTLSMGERWQYEVELPIDYKRGQCINFRLTPFYRLRQYGEKLDYPFDFIETKYQNFGLRLLATYSF